MSVYRPLQLDSTPTIAARLSCLQLGRWLPIVLFSLLTAATTLSAQAIPGTLASTFSTKSVNIGHNCTQLFRIWTWTFTDPSGVAHSFSEPSQQISNLSPTKTCTGGSDLPANEWSTDGKYFLKADQGTGSITAASGYLNPKYKIMGVTYAPPGGNQNSSVSYANTNFVGNTSTNSSSFSKNFTYSISVCGATGDATCQSQGGESGTTLGDMFGFGLGVAITGSETQSWTQASNTSTTITTSKQTSITEITPGIPNIFSPVNHDYDIVWIWLNPVALFTIVPNACAAPNTTCLYWNGYGYDWADPQHEPDVWPVLVGYLNGDFKKSDGSACYAIDPSCDAQDADALSRNWVSTQIFASGDGPALTQTDLQNICTHSDPFCSNPNYLVSLIAGVSPPTTTDQRFTLAEAANNTVDQTFPYKQAGLNSTKGETIGYNQQTSNTTAQSQGGTNTYSHGFGLEEKFNASFFWQELQLDIKQNYTLTWTDSWQDTITNTATKTDIATITGPPCPALTAPCLPAFTEPHDFAVYQDNIYGTFMFWPNPYFTIGVTPGTQTVRAGSSTTFTIPTTANAGYSGNLTSFSVSGLPSGAAGSFSPGNGAAGSITPTLTINTNSSTPAGTYPLTITGTDGSLTYFACFSNCVSATQPYAVLTVTSAPGFMISASPGSQTIAIGAGTTYTVTATATNGFTGIVNFSVTGLPDFASANFTPQSVTGSGSSALSISTTANTPPGTYPLTITCTSGSIIQTTTVNLVVTGANFTLSATPQFEAIPPGSNASYTVTATAMSGFTGSIDLSISGLPSGASANFGSTVLNGSGSTTLTVSTLSTIAPGDYNLTITGTSGSLTQTTTITLEVN